MHSTRIGPRTIVPAVLLIFLLHSAAAAQPNQRFLLASDIHFDPMADPKLVPELVKADATHWEAILARSQSQAFSQYGQDTNWWLLKSSLDAMRATIRHPAFIVITGDLLAHNFPQRYLAITHDTAREHYPEFVFNTMQFLSLQLRRHFPQTKIFITPGNNDEDCGNYTVRAGGRFLRDTAPMIRQLAHGGEDLAQSWRALGSYDVPHPTLRGVRIISINTVFFSNKYQPDSYKAGCAVVPSNGSDQAFAWLESRLSAAQQAHEKVWLMFHIPPGVDPYTTVQQFASSVKKAAAGASIEQLCNSAVVPMWTPSWTSRFDALLQKYADTVVASFAGHTHTDDFRVLGASTANPSFILINPPISPVYNQNPGFRVVTFAQDASIADASVYYLTNLTFASRTTPGTWELEYRFATTWDVPRVDGANLRALYGRIVANEADRNQWLKFYNVSSAVALLPRKSTPGLYCAIEGLAPDAYAQCYCPAAAKSMQPGAAVSNQR